MNYRSGLIVGKFCPLHSGHQLLIDTALAQCERVIVVSYTNPDIPGFDRALRERWLRDLYPNVNSLVLDQTWLDAQELCGPFSKIPHDDDAEEDHRKFTAWLCHSVLGEAVDAVFTSEDYGDGFADVLSEWLSDHAGTTHRVVHVCVDKARGRVPVSGTKVRNSPWDYADLMDPRVRALFVKRIAVLGGESTGKTTLCASLAERLQTVWVPEYGRDLWVEKDGSLEFADMLRIGKRQVVLEEQALQSAHRWLVCDTSPLTTMFYSQALFNAVDPELARLALRLYDQVVLCAPDIAFVQDGTRQDEAFRNLQHAWHLEKLNALGIPYILLSGPLKVRLDIAASLLDRAANLT